MGGIPRELEMKQKARRQETVNSIKEAIKDLEDEGYFVSIKQIMERTGLSRAVFNKPHVEEILKEKGVGKYRKIEKVDIVEADIRQRVVQLERELDKNLLKISRLEEELKNKNKRVSKLEEENRQITDQVERLRGKMFVVMNKAVIKGVIYDDELYE